MQSAPRPPRIEHLSPLLAHFPEYSIVVCKACKFAVQPKALSSHLLRHRIYRDKRRVLLDRLAKLRLLDPNEVNHPFRKGPPLPHLSVASGYRCVKPTCDHLCMSQKRMSQHLREQHGESQHQPLGAPQVYVQTFFRGNKVRYFEVEPGTSESPALDLTSPDSAAPYSLPENSEQTAASPSTSGVASCPVEREDASITQPQMQDLMHLHHYTTQAGLSMTRGTESSEFWTHEMPLQASNQPFLMHGMLGVAAFHQAWLTSDPDERKRHHVAGLRHQSVGLNIFREILNTPTTENSAALAAFARLLGVQNCGETLLDVEAHSAQYIDGELRSRRVAHISAFMLLLKGGLDILLSMQRLLPSKSPLILPEEALQGLGPLEISSDALGGLTPYLVNEVCGGLMSLEVLNSGTLEKGWHYYRVGTLEDVRDLVDLCLRFSQIKGTRQDTITTKWTQDNLPSTSGWINHVDVLTSVLLDSYNAATTAYHANKSGACPILLCYPHIPPDLYSRLVSLPARIFSVVARPAKQDLKAFNEAMAALVSSFSRSHAGDIAWTRWNGIESWPRMLSEHFLGMIEAIHPAALVLVAHWCVLVSQQEDSYWFLQGQSRRMLDIVLFNLSRPLQEFVRGCISALT